MEETKRHTHRANRGSLLLTQGLRNARKLESKRKRKLRKEAERTMASPTKPTRQAAHTELGSPAAETYSIYRPNSYDNNSLHKPKLAATQTPPQPILQHSLPRRTPPHTLTANA